LRLEESPVDLQATKRSPEDIPAKEMRAQIKRWIAQGQETVDLGQWQMSLARRYAMPFYCLVFALIGAPLGLRHHRTSSAVGLGISLIVIFAFYAVSVYMSFFGRNGMIDPNVAAWLPNVIGAAVGVGLIVKANK
jgi:lipopolysaccharide export system permease protein